MQVIYLTLSERLYFHSNFFGNELHGNAIYKPHISLRIIVPKRR